MQTASDLLARPVVMRIVPAVFCGPDDSAQAHQPDECRTVTQFNAGFNVGWRCIERRGADLGT